MALCTPHKLADCLTHHAWNSDFTQVAVSPNTSEVQIFQVSKESNEDWNCIYTLQQHDDLISGISWGSITNKIVTCSYDRNAYVWEFQDSKWISNLVILKLNRFATSAKWSPKENKFALGSGSKVVTICYFDKENDWWIGKVVKKKHYSSVTDIAWHPNNILIATISTDFLCRIFSTMIKGTDPRDSSCSPFQESKFGEQLLEIDVGNSWLRGIKFSPSGNILVFVGHDSTIHFIKNFSPNFDTQTLYLKDLPLKDVLFLSENLIMGVGFDCNPMLFSCDSEKNWSFVKFLENQKKKDKNVTQTPTKFSEVLGKFDAQTRLGESNIEILNSNLPLTTHKKCIVEIAPLSPLDQKTILKFSTIGLDGRLVFWNVSSIEVPVTLGSVT